MSTIGVSFCLSMFGRRAKCRARSGINYVQFVTRVNPGPDREKMFKFSTSDRVVTLTRPTKTVVRRVTLVWLKFHPALFLSIFYFRGVRRVPVGPCSRWVSHRLGHVALPTAGFGGVGAC